MSNTEAAVEFLRMASSGQVREAYERYVGPTFTHHNPHVAAGADQLRQAMEQAHATDPNKALEVQRTIADGEFVWVHSRVRKEASDIAVVHIFRFADGRVAELWDIAAVLPEKSPNTVGAF